MAYAIIRHDESHLDHTERKKPGVRIRKCRRLLAQQGIKYIETPNHDGDRTLFTFLPEGGLPL